MVLPVPRDRLIGRERDVATLAAVLEEHRLVTLTGVGGTGKTRLAIAVAAMLSCGHDLTVFVDLTSVGHDTQVSAALAEAVQAQARPGQSPLDGAVALLSNRRALLVIDNAEHVIDAVAETVENAPRSLSVHHGARHQPRTVGCER